MANKKKSNSGSTWGLNKIAFWTIVLVALLYAVSVVLSALGIGGFRIIGILQSVATAIMIILVAVLAWRHVRAKDIAWRVLYIICILIVLAGIVLPLVL